MQTQPQKVEPLTENTIAEIREIFTLFDKDSDGFVNVEELGTMIRALYMNPTDAEVEALKKEIDQGNIGKFDQNSFMSTVAKRGKDPETMDDLIEALTIISAEGEKANIRTDRFKFYMSDNGEKIPKNEVDEILADLDIVHEDYINIDELAKILMTK